MRLNYEFNPKITMRKVLVFSFLSYCITLSAQDYKPLLDNFNEWHVTSCYFGCLTDVYYTDGDTTVNGKVHKVLDGSHYISRTFLLHEEVSTKKVSLTLVDGAMNEEYLLYDFSLTIGDSIPMLNPISPFPEEAGYYRLDSIINRPLADGNEYRHFYLSPTATNPISATNATWIEGVGSLSLINAPSGDPDINGAGHLSCFFKNGELFYSNLDSIDGCEPVILSNSLNHSTLDALTVVNTGQDNHCQLLNTTSVRLLDIYNLSGQRLQSISNGGEHSLLLDFSGYGSGVYLLVAYDLLFKQRTFKVLIN